MKHRTVRIALGLLVIGMAGASVARAEGSIADEVREHWKDTRNTMLTIAGAVPENNLDFKPVPEVRSFREMLEHMVEDTAVHVGYSAGKSREESAQAVAKYLKAKTKAELLEGLEASYDYGDRILADLTDQNALDMVTGMRGARMTRITVPNSGLPVAPSALYRLSRFKSAVLATCPMPRARATMPSASRTKAASPVSSAAVM